MMRKLQRVGKKAAKFQYTATYQSVVVECTTKDKWRPSEICVSWTRRGRRFITELRPWQPSPDNKARGVVIWPDPEVMEVTITLYKGPKDQSYEAKEWDFAVIDVDESGKRKVLATTPINMVRYLSSLPYEHDVHLRLKPVSRKIKAVILDVSITSEFLREGKAMDDDMMSIASMMSVSNLSTIGFLEDEEDDDYNYMVGFRSISPPQVPEHILSTDELLKWAQELTKDLPDLKITNMTTSWRSGMGFLAIIHHFRPDLLPDFDVLSPNSIKENNRTAFNIARSLGVACPLTPNMMVTTTVPDKLSVMSFVYLMYQYFTKDTMSAIAKAEREEAAQGNTAGVQDKQGATPSSPFDLSKFQMFSSNISPVTTPTAQADRVMQYSRHLQETAQTPCETLGENDEKSADICPNEGDNISTPADQLCLDRVINEHTLHVASSRESEIQLAERVGDRDHDRETGLEKINADTEDEESSQTEGSISSLPDDDNTELPSEIQNASPTSSSELSSANLYIYTPGKDRASLQKATSTTAGNSKPASRKLPTTPVATSSPKLSDKKEDIRRQAQEMLRRHKLDKFKISQNISMDSNSDSPNASKYRQQAIDLLSQTFGTHGKSSTATRLVEDTKGDDTSSDFVSCEGSSTSRSVSNSHAELSIQSKSLQNINQEAKGDVSMTAGASDKGKRTRRLPLLVGAEAKDECEDVVRASSGVSTGIEVFNGKHMNLSGNGMASSSSEVERNGKLDISEAGTGAGLAHEKKHPMPVRRYSEGNITFELRSLEGKVPHVGVKHGKVGVMTAENDASPSSSPKFRRRSSSTDRAEIKSSEQHGEVVIPLEKTKKKVIKLAPTVRPIPVRPSPALQRMLDEKEKEQQQQSLEFDLCEQQDANAEEDRDRKEDTDMISSRKNSRTTPTRSCTPSKKRLPSPSACSQQSDDISQDLLVSQSEYVKVQLRSLQADVQDLERRAQNIEVSIRVSMSTLNKEEEESLMQEWFVLLNRKNELIKRQIQLNMIEKEEELEKKQFFLNRELRPLNEIPEEEKSKEQKEREDRLLKELFELIDERDRLEKRKMASMKIVNYEESLAQTQAKPAVEITGRRATSKKMQGTSKDCVIS